MKIWAYRQFGHFLRGPGRFGFGLGQYLHIGLFVSGIIYTLGFSFRPIRETELPKMKMWTSRQIGPFFTWARAFRFWAWEVFIYWAFSFRPIKETGLPKIKLVGFSTILGHFTWPSAHLFWAWAIFIYWAFSFRPITETGLPKIKLWASRPF